MDLVRLITINQSLYIIRDPYNYINFTFLRIKKSFSLNALEKTSIQKNVSAAVMNKKNIVRKHFTKTRQVHILLQKTHTTDTRHTRSA